MKQYPGRPIELYLVAVQPGTLLRGVGSMLVREGFGRAADGGGCTDGMLFVDATNERARRLYESIGFYPVRRQDVVRLVSEGR